MNFKEFTDLLTTGPLRPFQDKAFITLWYTCNIVALITWLLTLIHKNLSQVDRIWPIIPTIYTWGFLFTAIYYNPGPEPAVRIDSEIELEDIKRSYGQTLVLESNNSSVIRLVVMTLFITMWGCRLTYNYWRKGLSFF
jgi:steroid 5-alpha reductase family enzyme